MLVDRPDITKVVLGVLVSVVALIGTVFGVSRAFVQKDTYDSTIAGINARLDKIDTAQDRIGSSQTRIETKLDWLIKNNR